MTSYKAYSIPQLVGHIKRVSKLTENVLLTAHARRRMRERRVLDAEVFNCLRRGNILRVPEEDLKTGHLICRMECYGASKNLTVCVALDDEDPLLIVVTVIA